MTTEAPERTYTTVDKSEWGDGPWMQEPDKIQFTDDATGLPCLLVRNVWIAPDECDVDTGSGSWCGYVGVSEGQPFYGVDYMDKATLPINHHCDEPWCAPSPEHVLSVHGGITFANFCQEGPEDRAICHIPNPGESDKVWWIGFDASHHRDFSPLLSVSLRRLLPPSPFRDRHERDEIYRDVAYMKAECANLAAQLMAVAQGAQNG